MPTRPLNLRTFDLNLLKVFDMVMVERSVTRAAARLAMTQPAVSNALRRLRDATQEELFLSAPTGMAPTAHAQALWPAVRAALDSLQQAMGPAAFNPGTDQRSFTLAMADATAALFVPALLRRFQAEQALADLRLVPLATRDPRAMLEQGQADAAVGFFPDAAAAIAAEGDTGALHCQPLYACRYVCVMQRGHALALPGALTLDAYCAAEHLRVSFAGRPRGFVDEALARLGRQRRVVLTVGEFFSAGAVVQQSQLLTVLPLSFVPATGFAQQLAVCALPLALPPIDVTLLWHRRHGHDMAQRWLRHALLQVAQEIAGAQRPSGTARNSDCSTTPAASMRQLEAPMKESLRA